MSATNGILSSVIEMTTTVILEEAAVPRVKDKSGKFKDGFDLAEMTLKLTGGKSGKRVLKEMEGSKEASKEKSKEGSKEKIKEGSKSSKESRKSAAAAKKKSAKQKFDISSESEGQGGGDEDEVVWGRLCGCFLTQNEGLHYMGSRSTNCPNVFPQPQ